MSVPRAPDTGESSRFKFGVDSGIMIFAPADESQAVQRPPIAVIFQRRRRANTYSLGEKSMVMADRRALCNSMIVILSGRIA